ncbi:hypothetical protein HK099_003636 [Clydaea vesicula]|uniref:UFSP1/2/DUB catalytic domain-containing protein n=1 Tax=Clydaea vesicula TaxID=447962 RepID=A0AAD5U760_9FUNG|nr:hypothetical protein HK099_003636 [Clydaea vesicula]
MENQIPCESCSLLINFEHFDEHAKTHGLETKTKGDEMTSKTIPCDVCFKDVNTSQYLEHYSFHNNDTFQNICDAELQHCLIPCESCKESVSVDEYASHIAMHQKDFENVKLINELLNEEKILKLELENFEKTLRKPMEEEDFFIDCELCSESILNKVYLEHQNFHQESDEKVQFNKLKRKYQEYNPNLSFSSKFENNLNSQLKRGKITQEEYSKKIELFDNLKNDPSKVSKGLVYPLFNNFKFLSHSTLKLKLCCKEVENFSFDFDDGSCGYKNLQNLLSSIWNKAPFKSKLVAVFNEFPHILTLQKTLEEAWYAGFDAEGCEQLGNKVYNTLKYIGGSEIYAILSFIGIDCTLVEFHLNKRKNDYEEVFFKYCMDYFDANENSDVALTEKFPLYLQHDGHSRTIIGYEIFKDEAKKQTKILSYLAAESTEDRAPDAVCDTTETTDTTEKIKIFLTKPKYFKYEPLFYFRQSLKSFETFDSYQLLKINNRVFDVGSKEWEDKKILKSSKY